MFRPTGTRLHSLFLLADLITQDFFFDAFWLQFRYNPDER
jgi:hypothetical protein